MTEHTVKIPGPDGKVKGAQRRPGRPPLRLIVFQPFAHADHIVDCIAQVSVELEGVLIGSPDLQINFRAAFGAQPSLGFLHYGPADAAALVLWRHNPAVHGTDQKQVRPHPQLAANVFVRVIGGPHQVALSPERDHRSFVFGLERANSD